MDHLGLKDARRLLARLQDGEAFRGYVQDRLRLVLPVFALAVLISFACAAATAISVIELSSWLALPAFLLAPVALAGSFYVQAVVFLLWVEGRALAQALGHRPRAGGMGELPRVPWLAAPALFVPLALLASLAPLLTLVLVAAGALAPVLYVRFDRGLTKVRVAV
ncbi:MAG TPA: hypothetical protein VMN03_03230 [Burkholderiales bacterium]|nr:hypothetical protein [Burkholderiales bacterium]